MSPALQNKMLYLCFGLLSQASFSAAPNNLAIVLNSGDETLSLIDTASMRETGRITIGKEPHHLMATPDEKFVIVANAASNELVFLDGATGEVMNRVKNISDPYQIGYSPDHKWFVSVSLRLDRVVYLEPGMFQLVKRIPLPQGTLAHGLLS